MIAAPDFKAAIGDWRRPLPTPRMAIYRNNVVSSLAGALKVRYPVVAALVGPEFWAAMARDFAAAERPPSPVLIGYGGSFPDFVQAYGPASSVPYLADVARLESCWWEAYHAADEDILPAEAFAGIAPEAWGEARFRFHPSLGILSSAHAVGSIWLAHHGGAAMGSFATGEPQSVLIARPRADVTVRLVAPAFAVLLSSLRSGACVADAVNDASEEAGFDLPTQLTGLVGLGIITEILT